MVNQLFSSYLTVHQAFHHQHPLQELKKKKILEIRITEKQKRKVTVTHLSQAEKAYHPHGLSCMVA